MQSQQNSYAKTGLNEFSSAMMRASAAERSPVQRRSNSNAKPRHDGPSAYNRNLSSILSRITDDGPANMQLDEDVNHIARQQARRPAKTDQANGNRSPAVAPEEQYGFARSFDFDDPDFRANAAGKHGKRGSLWQQSVLMLLCSVIAVMGYFLLQLKIEAEEMKHSLHSSQEQISLASGVQAQQSDVLPRLNSMNEALKDLKQELHGIKVGYQQSDSKLAMDIPRELEPRLLEIAAASEIVTVLQDEFERIQHEMQEMGSELRVIKSGIPASPDTSVSPDTVEAPVAVAVQNPNTPNLVVNLASLTSRDKALAAIEKLQKAGVSPLIQEVMVNGRIVFRISVDGFTSRDAASAFIAEAKSKYGFDGGWIRRF